MLPYFVPIEGYQKKFYSKENGSHRFLDLSEEHLLELSKKVYEIQEKMFDSPLHRIDKISKLEYYKKIMEYLTSQHIHLELSTFDERIAFLIMTVDPNLVTFKEFLKTNLISKADIAKIADKEERIRLINERKQTMSDYENNVREQIGFYDPKLLKYEERFFLKFFGDKELVTQVGSNNHDLLIFKAKFLKDFDNISDERFDELNNIAQIWLSLIPEEDIAKVASYNITNQKKLMGLNNTSEQLALFIILVDSELDMLRIYEEESMISNVEKRIIEQFGFFDKELLNLERKFHARFCPEKEISFWTMTKKD